MAEASNRPASEEQPAPTSGARRYLPSNLPASLTSFVGREAILERVRQTLWRVDVRLLTLTGPPGIGKTRLSVEAASGLVDDFTDGVVFVPLASISDPGMVLPEIAQLLGMRDTPGRSPAQSIGEQLRDKNILLVLDNFEHLLDAGSAVSDLLKVASRLKVLVTSRTPLHLYGEHELAVPALELPDRVQAPNDVPTTLKLQPSTVENYDAVRLFVRRVQAVQPTFALNDENAVAVVEICRRLEGSPLAIELAAARIKHLTPQELLERLVRHGQLEMLVGVTRDLSPRQRTLRGAIDWSYDLLGPQEQHLFRALGVIAAGVTPQGAAALSDAGGSHDLLSALTDNSLLRQEGAGDRLRYSMLEPVREYALEQLEVNGEEGRTRRRHADYMLTLVEELGMGITGPGQSAWLDRIGAEHDNARAALAWLLEHGRGDLELTEVALRLGSPMYTFWNARGYFTEGRQWMDKLLHNAELIPHEQRSEKFRTLQASVNSAAGLLAWNQGEDEKARPFIEASLTLRRELNLKQGIASSLNNLGLLAMNKGEYESACAYYEESLALAREGDVRWHIALFLNNLGVCYWEMGDTETAARYYEDALAEYRRLEDKSGLIMALDNLGMVATHKGDFALAHRYQTECLALCNELGHKNSLAHVLVNTGLTAVEEGDFTRALQLFSEALPILEQLDYKGVIAKCFEGLASIQAGQGQFTDAARYWGAASAIREGIGKLISVHSRPLHESRISSARAQVDAEAFDAAWAEGRAATVAETIKFALGLLSVYNEAPW